MIKINFDNTYDLTVAVIEKDFSLAEFYSPQINGKSVLLRVIIEQHPDPLLTGVYNLAMGPAVAQLGIDDKIRLRHTHSSKVFSTVILFALAYLTEHSEMIIGLDGTDDLRANLYHSMFIVNRQNLNEYFDTIGVDWYVKLLRNEIEIERKPDGSPFFKPRPEAFDYKRTRHDLYRYYMFELK